MKPLYLYGIIPSNDKIIFDEVCGMDDDEDAVYTLPHNGVAAVVGSSPREDYRGLKRDEAVRYMVNHQSVIEAVQSHFTILPVKFGTVLPDMTFMDRMLHQGRLQFQNALSNLHGLTQMEVVTLWKLPKVFQEIGNEAPIVALKAKIAGFVGEQDQTLEDRIMIGRLVKEAIDARRAMLSEQIAPRLRSVARDSILNPILDDSIVINVALLLDESGRKNLDQMLDALDKTYNGQMTFRAIGPLPPYSFASVDVQTPALDAIETARQLLQCGLNPTVEDIKRAYYQAAKGVHPDLNANGRDTDGRMTALTQAYRLLISTADSQLLSKADLHAPLGNATCCFDRATIENTLLITVKRQSDLPVNTAAG